MKKNMPGIPESATNEESARAFLESILWSDGVACPHCKAKDAYKMTPKAGSTRPGRKGLYRCRPCKRQFTVTVGTIFEGSHIPLHKWLMGVHLMTCSKKGISAHQLHRMLGITYKAARKRKKKDEPISLVPLSFEEAVRALASTKPPKKKRKRT